MSDSRQLGNFNVISFARILSKLIKCTFKLDEVHVLELVGCWFLELNFCRIIPTICLSDMITLSPLLFSRPFIAYVCVGAQRRRTQSGRRISILAGSEVIRSSPSRNGNARSPLLALPSAQGSGSDSTSPPFGSSLTPTAARAG